jgi:hypothetical protein
METVKIDSMIVVILGPRPLIRYIPKGTTAFELDDDHFEDVGLGYHNGFYDFLRSRTGAIIGLRLSPPADAERLLAEVTEGKYLRFTREGYQQVLSMFWGHEQDFDSETSSDQYFGDNTIYRAKRTGRLAVSFGVDLLSSAEKASLPISMESA